MWNCVSTMLLTKLACFPSVRFCKVAYTFPSSWKTFIIWAAKILEWSGRYIKGIHIPDMHYFPTFAKRACIVMSTKGKKDDNRIRICPEHLSMQI
jgi:hypothetical protein